MFSTDDTIVAVATPPGRGGLGVVRLSGPRALAIIERLIGVGQLEPRTATLATITRDAGGAAEPIDQVLATAFPAPQSYTGDDVVELSAHGSPVVLEGILDAAMRGGARLAEPGEFTLRGFLNGRIDLVQAEAVADLVEAVTPAQARLAYDQLDGTLSTAIGDIDATLFDLIARLEASLDFPDEGYHFIERSEAADAIGEVAERVGALLASGRRGRVIREGRQVVIVGCPNTGKSSIFNALLGTGRAIVTDLPGTTRDLVTETLDIDGVPVRLVDTAGVREAGDAVEVEGVTRARGALSVADLALVIFDRSRPFERDDAELLTETMSIARLLVVNKTDRPSAWDADPLASADGRVEISATAPSGAEPLREALAARLATDEPRRDSAAIANVRHLDLLERAKAALARAAAAVTAQVSEEFVLADLQEARAAFEEVTGKRTTDDLLQRIFSRFCVGK
jgi:tRNA modification GTPase